VLADTNRSRIFVFSTGRREQTIDVVGQKTKRVKGRGWSQARYQRHAENFHLHHAKEVVEALDAVVREDQIDHVILAGDEAAAPLIEKELPKHLAEKVVDVMRLDARTPDDEVLRETLAVPPRKGRRNRSGCRLAPPRRIPRRRSRHHRRGRDAHGARARSSGHSWC
jgi:hypothetical protein